MLGTVQKFV